MESKEPKSRNLTWKEQAFYATLLLVLTIAYLVLSHHIGCDTPANHRDDTPVGF